MIQHFQDTQQKPPFIKGHMKKLKMMSHEKDVSWIPFVCKVQSIVRKKSNGNIVLKLVDDEVKWNVVVTSPSILSMIGEKQLKKGMYIICTSYYCTYIHELGHSVLSLGRIAIAY